jgi:hypothetical protein
VMDDNVVKTMMDDDIFEFATNGKGRWIMTDGDGW